jgi:hypothetical protein
MSDSEREDLQALMSSPGWLRFKAWAKAEYGPLLLARVADEPNDAEAIVKLRQARAVTEAADVMLKWPERTLADHARRAAHGSADPNSRRGGL